MPETIVRPARNVHGSIGLPGDKSISHRYAMLAALAAGRSRFDNYSPGADCASTLGCVKALGCNVERDEKGAVVIDGLGPQLKLDYSPRDHKGFDHVLPTVIRGGRAVPFTDWATVAAK